MPFKLVLQITLKFFFLLEQNQFHNTKLYFNHIHANSLDSVSFPFTYTHRGGVQTAEITQDRLEGRRRVSHYIKTKLHHAHVHHARIRRSIELANPIPNVIRGPSIKDIRNEGGGRGYTELSDNHSPQNIPRNKSCC